MARLAPYGAARKAQATVVRRHPLLAYVALACAITWLLWLPRVATEQDWWARDVPEWWHYAGAAGPPVAAFVVAALAEGRIGVRVLLAQFEPSRLRSRYAVLALAGLLALFAAGVIAARLSDGEWPAYSELAKSNNLPAIGLPLTLAVQVLTFGIGEEVGWRGFALPHLQQSRRAMPATAIMFAGWAAWHVPSFFENPDFQDMTVPLIVGWAAGLALGAVLLTWLYNSTSASLLVVAVWHGLFNTISASEAASDVIAPVVSTGVMLAAVGVLVVAGPAELRGLSRHAGRRMRWSDLLPPATRDGPA